MTFDFNFFSKMATIKQDGLASSSGNGSIEWILYLSFPKGFSSMHFVFDAQVGNYKTTQAFELANDNALPSVSERVSDFKAILIWRRHESSLHTLPP